MLKKSFLVGKNQNFEERKCLAIREDRSKNILTQIYFCEFRKKEFLNSHWIYL